jgi:pyruvate/2-oxoglutarate dehydrogenase complex dihydrolipoamide acyltransferase (E2) component
VKNSQPIEIVLPDLGTDNATFSLWYVRPGDRVYEGDRVAEVLIPGATFDVSAPVSGILTERLTLPNDLLAPGQVLGIVQDIDQSPDSL